VNEVELGLQLRMLHSQVSCLQSLNIIARISGANVYLAKERSATENLGGTPMSRDLLLATF